LDPQTVILILALNLVAIGSLMALIDKSMSPLARPKGETQGSQPEAMALSNAAGLHDFAVGSVVFGLAYLLRLALGPASGSLFGTVADAGMIFATLSFASGLRHYGGRPRLARRVVVSWVSVFVAVSLAATLQWQATGRHAVLNLSLAAAYLSLAFLAMAATGRVGSRLRPPLRVLALVIGVLGALTAVRGLSVPFAGVASLFSGFAAQVYYGYSTLVTVVLGPNLLWLIFLRLNERLTELATHDPLTGLLNRNGLDEALNRHFGIRPPRPLVLLQVDIDHFKRINDLHGHAAGDSVLRGVADTLAGQLRGADFVARLGGEEFLVGCDTGDRDHAAALADRLRRAVAEARHAVPDGGVLACTVSIGVSGVFDDRAAWESALREADHALFAAKKGGRDRVELGLEPRSAA
jgi:diguanylate cyclase (GGDEF)-like protein